MIENDDLDAVDLAELRAALGLDHAKSPNRNRTAANIGGFRFPRLARLERLGLLAEDHDEHYGRMRVFRVTAAGMNAAGQVRHKAELLALVPRVVAPLPLAA